MSKQMIVTPKAVDIFKLVAAAGEEGTTRQTLSEQVGTQPATVSMYLTQLRHIDLIETLNGKVRVASNKEAHQYAKHPDQLVTSRRGRTSDPTSKASLARKLIHDMIGKPRHEIIQAMISSIGLTPAGAATYYQNLKSSATTDEPSGLTKVQ